MALYPQTTCFYKGLIHELPKNVRLTDCPHSIIIAVWPCLIGQSQKSYQHITRDSGLATISYISSDNGQLVDSIPQLTICDERWTSRPSFGVLSASASEK